MESLLYILTYVLDKFVRPLEKIPYFAESNRAKHFVYAIPIGIISIGVVIGIAIGMEYKDHLKGGKFDLHDLFVTILGGFLGATLKLIIVALLF